MFKQRIITALLLLPLMLGMLFFASQTVWIIFSGIIALLALWEYGRLMGLVKNQNNRYVIFTLLFGLIAALGYWQLPRLAWLAVLLFWLVVVPCWLIGKWSLRPDWRGYLVGISSIVPFWFALTDLRQTPEQSFSLLAVMGLVWVSDTFAYFTGKQAGKHKLAPMISPGKSWEGFVGALVAVWIYATCGWFWDWFGWSASWIITVLAATTLMIISVCGDLFESWLKRLAGMKDSSHLLPGHGGILDRIDSLIAVLSTYAAVMAWIN